MANKDLRDGSEVLRITHQSLLPSLPRRHPDILHLGRLVQELVTFALFAGHPIARQAVADPRPLHVGGGLVLHPVTAFRRAEVPDRVHVFVLDESLGQVVAVARDNVDHAANS
ncbi:MAG: hypothetical protein FJZ86_10955 [Chloroflexi bacterium]|nr:hypothetical protein [Chloroflexota bacterium]